MRWLLGNVHLSCRLDINGCVASLPLLNASIYFNPDQSDATETVEPSKVSIPGLQSSFVPQGEATLIHQNEKGELVGPEGSAKSVDEYLYCRLCQAKFEVVKDAMVHYNGEDHKEILIALGKTQGKLYGQTYFVGDTACLHSETFKISETIL